MKSTNRRALLALCAAVLTLAVCGCGKGGPALTDEQKDQFESAIGRYCKEKSMGLAVSAFSAPCAVKGDEATVTCRMKAAEGPGVTSKFTYTLKKVDDKWTVTGHKR